MTLWSSVAPKLTTTSQSSQFDSLTRDGIGYSATKYPICQRTLQRGAVRSCEINCNYTYTCPYRICHETWEITYQSQLCVNKHMSPRHYIKHWRPQKWNLENCQANKFQKDQLPSFSIFFKSVHLFLIFTLTKIFICTHSCSLLCYLKLLFMFHLSSIFMFHWDWWWFPLL